MYEIKVKIHEEADLYNPLDPDKAHLRDEKEKSPSLSTFSVICL